MNQISISPEAVSSDAPNVPYGSLDPLGFLLLSMKEIPLTRGFVTIVDDEDFEKFGHLKWYADVYHPGKVYARRKSLDGTMVHLHREVMGVGGDGLVDHINRNPLDNRRENLRVATFSQNATNATRAPGKSLFRGVTAYRCKGFPFRAQIRVNGKFHHLGGFASAEDAAHAYDRAAIKLHGEFAVLNFDRSSYGI